MSILTTILNAIKNILKTEPALVIGGIVAVLGAVAGALGIVVDTATLGQIAAYIVAVLTGAIATRSKVTPV